MPLAALRPIDTRELFRPVSSALVSLLRDLKLEDWQKPTVAGSWVVRDVVAHLLDITLRRVSFHRDGMPPPPPPIAIQSEQDFVRFINLINAQWVDATRRCSPRVLTDIFELASRDVADWFESLPLEAPALFGVSWAGEQVSEGWFDIGREFTELWHHQEQIRIAVGAPSLKDPRYLHAVIAVAVRGLPHAYRDVRGAADDAVTVDVTGASGGRWTLLSDGSRWSLHGGEPDAPATRVTVSDDNAWKLLFNALPPATAFAAVQIEGRSDLALPLITARSVIV